MSAKTRRLQNRLRIEHERADRAAKRVKAVERELHEARREFLRKMGMFEPAMILKPITATAKPYPEYAAVEFVVPAMRWRQAVMPKELLDPSMRLDMSAAITRAFADSLRFEIENYVTGWVAQVAGALRSQGVTE